ncbi:MAG: hypothetical protein ACXV3D_03745 [Halobacteriota archaeon]
MAEVVCSNHTGPICFSFSLDHWGSPSSGIKVATSSDCVAYGTAGHERALVKHGDVSVAQQTSPDGQTLGTLVLSFSRDELCSYVDARIAGLAEKSRYWIVRAAQLLWRNSEGEVSRATMERLRKAIFAQYTCEWSHRKTLNFVKAFLKHLARTCLDTRYAAFEVFLEMPRMVRVRKAVTSRIVTPKDIENVLACIQRAEAKGAISRGRALQYTAFVVLGAYTGQRSLATIARLTVGQFRESFVRDKPVLHVTAQQDKIRMEHYVPLHPAVISALTPLFDGRKDAELLFEYNSVQMWVKRQQIPMSRFKGHFVLGDLRKFAEQHGDVIGWDQSNRAYILTHGVSGVDWSHYKHPLPEHVYDIYMRYWGGVRL